MANDRVSPRMKCNAVNHKFMAPDTLKIGDTVYLFDSNRRIYGKDRSGPIWREHWYPAKVTGETSRSWIIGDHPWTQCKLPKKGKPSFAIAYSQEEIDRESWIQDNRYQISKLVDRCGDYEVLQKIAELLGYKQERATE